jgi:hypothetical protein
LRWFFAQALDIMVKIAVCLILGFAVYGFYKFIEGFL